jgi:hypothetical protein
MVFLPVKDLFVRKAQKSNQLRTLILIILTCGLCSCVPLQRKSPYVSLKSAGIQVLSGSNPYHGPNVILAESLEESPTLAGYFQHFGAPQAIEVREARPSREELLLYYPEEYRVYVAKRSLNRQIQMAPSDWMIAGPYGIGKHDLKMIQNFRESEEDVPVFLLHGHLTRFKPKPQKMQIVALEPDIPLITTAVKPKPKKVKKKKKKSSEDEDEGSSDDEEEEKKPKKKKKVSSSTFRGPNLDDPNFIPKNTDQEALLLSQGYAKRAPNGDILHDIEGSVQNLKNIAHWYTGSTRKAREIQDANNFPHNQFDIRRGTVVRIPQKLIKNTKKMPMNHRAIKAPKIKPKKTKDLKEELKKFEEEGAIEIVPVPSPEEV